ncbi:MAG: hypothetical protein ACI4GY_07985 [Acutalibacteraceae bacterium]
MNMLKFYKCICCLIKCSKCLYFIKKILCFTTLALLAGGLVMSMCDKKTCKKLMSKIKAVM